MNITNGESEYRTFNLGSGKGTSVNEIIHAVRATIKTNSEVRYHEIRNIDVPVNYLDMTRYNTEFGQINYHTLEQGIRQTADYLIKAFHMNKTEFM
jgi:UDP-glucose 4-epimerase